jgi:hypothetical protein
LYKAGQYSVSLFICVDDCPSDDDTPLVTENLVVYYYNRNGAIGERILREETEK